MNTLVSLENYSTQEGKVINQFLKDKNKKSEHTYIAYKTDIEQLIKGLFKKPIKQVTKRDLNSIDLTVLKEYFDHMYEQAQSKEIKCTNSTINRKQSTAKELIKYLKARNIIDGDISFLDLIKNLPDKSQTIEYMPVDVALQYAEYCRRHEKHKGEEKYRLLLLAIDSGLRLGELLAMRWSDFVEEDGYVLIRGWGKGNKTWVEKISYDLYNTLLEIKGNSNDKVFSLSRKNVTDMMNRAKKALQHENRNYSFHSFKKTAVTFTKRLTGSLEQAQKKGRHSSFETTKIYLEEEDHQMTGAISLSSGLNHNLYKEVSHSELLEALSEMNKDSLFILNMKLKQKQDKKCNDKGNI